MDDVKRKYESDLTSKEKRHLEMQKIKAMNWKQRTRYIFDYYKFVFILAAVMVIIVKIGIGIYQNFQAIELISIAIADVSDDNGEGSDKIQKDLLEYMGSGDEDEEITLDTSAMSGDGYMASMKMSTVMSAGTTDILICDKETYEKYEEQGAFQDWEEVLGTEYPDFAGYLADGEFNLADSEKWNQYQLVAYEPVYIGMLAGSDNEEKAAELLKYFYSGNE